MGHQSSLGNVANGSTVHHGSMSSISSGGSSTRWLDGSSKFHDNSTTRPYLRYQTSSTQQGAKRRRPCCKLPSTAFNTQEVIQISPNSSWTAAQQHSSWCSALGPSKIHQLRCHGQSHLRRREKAAQFGYGNPCSSWVCLKIGYP